MDKELKAKWVAALRSGEYRQDTRMLRSYRGYCCLGVLCEVAEAPKIEGTSMTFFLEQDATYIPLFLENKGVFPDIQQVLVSMNDHRKQSFPQIADYIEANL